MEAVSVDEDDYEAMLDDSICELFPTSEEQEAFTDDAVGEIYPLACFKRGETDISRIAGTNDEDLGRRLFQAEEARLPVEAASTPRGINDTFDSSLARCSSADRPTSTQDAAPPCVEVVVGGLGQKGILADIGLALTCFSLVTVSPPPKTALATMCDWAKVKELCPESCAVADEEAVERAELEEAIGMLEQMQPASEVEDDARTAKWTRAEDRQGRDRRRLDKPNC